MSVQLVVLILLAGCGQSGGERPRPPEAVHRDDTSVITTAGDPTCRSADDCAITCSRSDTDCCGERCECTTPIHREALAVREAKLRRHCEDAPRDCPKADCPMPQSDTVAGCARHRCVAVAVPRPTTCTSDADCELSCDSFESCCGDACGPCRHAYHKDVIRALRRWKAEHCRSVGCRRTSCVPAEYRTEAACEAGICTVRQLPL